MAVVSEMRENLHKIQLMDNIPLMRRFDANVRATFASRGPGILSKAKDAAAVICANEALTLALARQCCGAAADRRSLRRVDPLLGPLWLRLPSRQARKKNQKKY